MNNTEPFKKLHIEFPQNLPISQKVAEIKEIWRRNQVIIIGGATGSGKTTQLPKIAIMLGRGKKGKIGCTQPRRIAATSMARRVSEEIQVNCGEEVGYQVRFDDKTSKKTRIKFMTDGILLSETSNDRNLYQYDTLIIDEAHERTLNIDFLLGYIKNLLAKRKDLKIAISSATLDLEKFSAFFNDAPIIQVEGKTYPVEEQFLPPIDNDEELEDHVVRAVKLVTSIDPYGDILLFLPGEREIHDTMKALKDENFRNLEILPLYARLSNTEQQKVFKKGANRRIILSTNVAETSLTINGIRFCIDSGLARISRYNPRTKVQELKIERISQASMNQRTGRCGRTADGICLHMYSEDEYNLAEKFTTPEINRTALSGVILKMLSLNLDDITEFPFIDPPVKNRIYEGIKNLEELLLVKTGGKRLTSAGYNVAKLPIDPHLGKMLHTASKEKVVLELIIIISFLSLQDPRERPLEKQQLADSMHKKYYHDRSDFITIINLWNAIVKGTDNFRTHGNIRRFAKQNFLNYNRVKEWQNLVNDLIDYSIDLNYLDNLPDDLIFEQYSYDKLHIALLSGIPRQIAKFDKEKDIYAGTTARKYSIFPGSALYKKRRNPEWMMSFSIVETSKLFGRTNAEISPKFAEIAAPHLCKAVYERPAYDEKNGFVYANKKLMLGGLVLEANKRVHYGKINPTEAKEIFIREALINSYIKLPHTFISKHYQKLDSLKKLELKLRRVGTIIDEEAIFEHYKNVLPNNIYSLENLKQLVQKDKQDFSMKRNNMMYDLNELHIIESDYPDYLSFSGEKFKLNYEYNFGEESDGLFLVVPEDKINLLPPWALDYLVMGYLGEKVELMLKSLPKAIRQRVAPISATCRNFIQNIRDGKLFTDCRLALLLCEYLNDEFNLELFVRHFEDTRLPEFLKMKLLTVDSDGRAMDIYTEIPNQTSSSSKISMNMDILSQYISTNNSEFPSLMTLPKSVEIPNSNGKIAYIALVDEIDTIGSNGFLNLHEAKVNHQKGVVRLFKLRNKDQIKFIKRATKLSREVLLSFFTKDHDKVYLDDILDSLINLSFGGNIWDNVRSEADFIKYENIAKMELGEASDKVVENLSKIQVQYEKLYTLLKTVRMRLHDKLDDLTWQLDFMFQTGFLRRPNVWSDYLRYLRAAQIRLERLNSNYSKDQQKYEEIEEYVEKFKLAVSTIDNIVDYPELYEFWLLLEESRIVTFAPEVHTKEKSILKKLSTTWQNLHF